MKSCFNKSCSSFIDMIMWEDNLEVCPICHSPIFDMTKITTESCDSELSEYTELEDTDFDTVLVSIPIPFKISTYKVYDEEKDIEKNIKIHVVEEINKMKVEIIDEIKEIENKIDVLSKKIESKHDLSDINKTIRVENIPNTSGSSRIDLLKDFINEGKTQVDKVSNDEVKDEKKLPNEVKGGKICNKDEMIIGRFIVNKKLFVASIMIIAILIVGVILQITTEKW